MKIPQWISFLLFVSITFACTSLQEKTATRQEQEIAIAPVKTFSYQILRNNLPSSLVINDIQIDTNSSLDAKGVKISAEVSINDAAVHENLKRGFDGYLMEISCKTDCNTFYSSNAFIDKRKRVHQNRDLLFTKAQHRTIELQIPYRNLAMHDGAHTLDVKLLAKPVKFKKDSSDADFRFIDKISDAETGSIEFTFKINSPPLLEALVEVEGFEINREVVDPSKYDFSIGGTGYPDLYWDLYCGNELIYYSPQEKNSTQFLKKFHTKPFLCSNDDIIRINVLDYDKGPFNTEDDVIYTWTGTVKELNSRKIHEEGIGNLKYFKATTKMTAKLALDQK